MTRAPPRSVTAQLQSFAIAWYPQRACHESPGEDCGQPHQIVGVNRRFHVWLRPRQRHNRRNLVVNQLQEKYLAAKKRLHGFRRPGEGD